MNTAAAEQATDIAKELDDLDFGGTTIVEVEPEVQSQDAPAPEDATDKPAATEAEPEKKDVDAQEIVAPVDGKADSKPDDTDAQKLREQIENLNNALREERNMRKKAQEEARQAALRPVAPVQAPEAVPPHGQENNESDIDPDVDRTVNRIVAPHITKLEQTIRLNRYQLDEIRVSQEYGAQEFNQATEAFKDLINPDSASFDPGMLKAFQESDRPALLAFNMGRARNIDAMLEKARSAGKDEGRQSVMDELKNKGKTIPSLSSVGGSSAQSSASGMRKELDEL